jgi:hypothetical protein
MKTPSKTVLIAVVMLCSVVSSFAWLRRHFSDAEIVSRAELIVVGHIQDGSVFFIPHTPPPSGGASWDHHAELLISEVLKGHTTSNSIVVSIHYGLQPEVSGWGSITDARVGTTNYPKGAVEVIDWGNSDRSGIAITGDIRTNHIWLLRQDSHPSNFDTDWIGVYDPEDIQPISKKDELLKYLK